VAKHPENIAVVAKSGQLTYRELNNRAEEIAGYLINQGVKADDLLGVLIDNQLEMIISVVAVIKSGAAYVPLAYDTPLERVSYILEDSQAKFILTTSGLVDGITTGARIIDVSDSGIKASYVRPNIKHDNLLYAIYTSGTTGKPKGTLLENRGVINYASFLIRDNNLDSSSSGSKFAGFGFDASVIEIYPILLSGGRLCLIPDEDKLDPTKVNAFFERNKIEYAFLPTQFAELFFELENSSLRNLIVGGDKLRKFTPKPYAIKNAYGPTEITVESNQFTVDQWYDNIPIGKPLSNYSCYVVDKSLNLLPIGVVGELLVGGDGLARGYLNQVELTEEKFIANPFQTEEEIRLDYNHRVYKTGDLVKWLADGNIEYIGRNDFQVKIRGYRIELGEIENRLQGLAGVEQSLVLALSDANKNSYLCAYYTGEEYQESELVSQLSQNLASYMIPEHFIWLEKFPINVNGKVDRRALPLPDLTKLSNEYVAPETEEERLICDEFANILGIDQIGINDDFYRLGGNSIKTIWLVSRLQSNFKITVADVFKHKTPALLAKHTAFVKDNLKRKLEQIKHSYTAAKSDIMFKDDQQLKYNNYLQQVENLNFELVVKDIQQIILTGATGYLGSNILYQLLVTTESTIVVLVRAKSNEEAYNRVIKKLLYYFDINIEQYAMRIVAYAANLESNTLGLSQTDYESLQFNTDMIIHSAALVKHYGEYPEFYQANVQATINLLDLCKLSRGRDFHYISTYSVLQDGYLPGYADYMVDENTDGSEFVARGNVYVQTKYEGEVVTRSYRQYGITSNIYRVGNLSMISTNSRNQENIDDNGFYTRIKAMLNLGIVSSEVATLEVSPVDITALAIVKLAYQKKLVNQNFHVYHPERVDLSDVLASDPTLRIRKLTISEFIDSLLLKINLTTYRNYIEMFMLHQGWLQEADEVQPQTNFWLKQHLTNNILSKLGVKWPKIDLALVSDLVFQAFKDRVNFLINNFSEDLLSMSSVLQIAKSSVLQHYEAGTVLVDQAQHDDNVKFIVSGFVDNYIKSKGGWVSTLQLIADGDVLNFEALIELSSSSSYEAVFDSVTTIEVSKADLYKLIMEYPPLYKNILSKILADKSTLQQMYACLK